MKELSGYSTTILLGEILKRNTMNDAPVKTERYGKHLEAVIPIGADNICFLTMTEEDLKALSISDNQFNGDIK